MQLFRYSVTTPLWAANSFLTPLPGVRSGAGEFGVIRQTPPSRWSSCLLDTGLNSLIAFAFDNPRLTTL